MTCVVAIADRGRVVMGADMLGSNGWTGTERADGKVFVKGPMVMGFTSSYRMGQLLRYKLVLPDHRSGVDTHEYLVAYFVEAVRECLKDGGYTTVTNGSEAGGTFLVGYQGAVWKVESDFQVGSPERAFAAVGCGEDFALGALHVAKGTARQRVKVALEAAARFSVGVGDRHEVVVGGES